MVKVPPLLLGIGAALMFWAGLELGELRGAAETTAKFDAREAYVKSEMKELGICAWWTAAEYDKLCEKEPE